MNVGPQQHQSVAAHYGVAIGLQSERRLTTTANAGQEVDLGGRRDRCAAGARNSGWSWLRLSQPSKEVERVMGIEPTLVVLDKRKQWPLPGSCRCVLKGPLLADPTLSRTVASCNARRCSFQPRSLSKCSEPQVQISPSPAACAVRVRSAHCCLLIGSVTLPRRLESPRRGVSGVGFTV